MKWWRIGVGIAILSLVFALIQLPDGKLHLIFCDVGQGDASLITKGDFQMLIDTGSKNRGVMECLSKHVPFWDRTLEVFVNTHPQEDHLGDLAAVMNHYEIGEVVLSSEEPAGKNTQSVYKMIEVNKIKQVIARKGDRLRYGELYFDVLWPSFAEASEGKPDVLGASSDDNAGSLVLVMGYPGFSALFTGDIGEDQELALDGAGVLTPVEVLKVAHHGSKYSSSVVFDEKVRPKWAVVSVGAKNSYGHPAPEILRRFDILGSSILRTDQNGEVEFVADGKSYGLVQ
ncbi:MBL fold metallo-hydrolase [Candidatus Collierbacteria bacterium]|nr:MBL fold metallo-hydrolase [Candidatus Collierbacteria bacterium]